MIFVNFKTYKEATGVKAVELVRLLSNCQAETKISIVPVVQAVDIRSSMIATLYTVWAQHADPVIQGQHTGWVTPEAVAEAGATGVFLNHSEHKLSEEELEKACQCCKEAGVGIVLFAASIQELRQIVKLKPTYAAYEPPELIASKETSVAKSKSEIISEAVKIVKEAGMPLVVGAGVKGKEDVKKSLELGAQGIAVSSAVVLAEDPRRAILDLTEGFKQ